MVKMIPAASDSPAEAAVWTWFASRIVPSRNKPRKINIPMTAAGMEAETVIPAFKPKYTLAAPMTTDSTTPSRTTRIVSSKVPDSLVFMC